MGIGMGALIAGLFGMNVSIYVLFRLPVLPSYRPAFSLPVTWKSTHTPLWVCPSHRVSLHFSLHGVVFEGPFLIPLGRSYCASSISALFRLAKIQKVGLSASSGRKSASG